MWLAHSFHPHPPKGLVWVERKVCSFPGPDLGLPSRFFSKSKSFDVHVLKLKFRQLCLCHKAKENCEINWMAFNQFCNYIWPPHMYPSNNARDRLLIKVVWQHVNLAFKTWSQVWSLSIYMVKGSMLLRVGTRKGVPTPKVWLVTCKEKVDFQYHH
jgi:hypothetical protein